MSGMQMAMMGGRSNVLSAVNLPSSTYNSVFGAGAIISDPVTCIASGGTPGYTYAWSFISGDSFIINSPTSATTTFTKNSGGANAFSGVYRCTVTDSASGVIVATPDVQIDLERLA